MTLTGNYIIGPNGFVKHDGLNPIKNMYAIHWYSGVGLCIHKISDDNRSYKIYFRWLARIAA